MPDTVYPCTTPSASGTDTFTLTLASGTDLLLFQILNAQGYELGFTVTAPGGGEINCPQPSYFQMPQCQTSAAGIYTVQVQNGNAAYTLAYRALLSDTTCTVANPSFASPELTASLSADGVGACYTLAMKAGQVLHANSTSANQDLLITVYDSTGAQICFDDQGDCTLTGTGPYFVEADAIYADAITYDLELNNITDPQGCLTTAQEVYGAAPGTSSEDRCRTLTVTTAGQYQVYAVSPQEGLTESTLYLPDGSVACTNTYADWPACQLAAGTYNLVADPWPKDPAHIGAVFIASDESRGCRATGDTGFASGPATGTFKGIGEEICLTLPATAGPAVYLFNQHSGVASAPQLEVLDATGAQVCPDGGYVFTDCTLTGTKSFRVILSGQQAGGGYRVLVQSSSSDRGCAAWPQSGFGGSWGATVKLTTTKDAACLSIPAKQHSTGEMIDYSNLANTVDAEVNVYGPAGNYVCSAASTTICSYTKGVSYTALLMSSTGKADTYHLVRRDVSRSARCSKPATTRPGGPSTTIRLTSALDAQCLRVTAAAADKFSFDIRAVAPDSAGAVLQVTNASGRIECSIYEPLCTVTGSTSYQLLVTALNYQGIAITAHADVWLVGTASGWAPACAAHSLSSAGWKPISVKLSESSAGYCAVLSEPANRDTDIFSPQEAGISPDEPYLSVEPATDWAHPFSMCAGGGYEACSVEGSSSTVSYVVLVYANTQPLPATYSFQGVCSSGCAGVPLYPAVTSVTPATGPSGSVNKLVLHGTNLNLGTQIVLMHDGLDVASSAPVSLSANGEALTALLNTEGVAPGRYDVMASDGMPASGYIPDGYQVTAAPAAPPVGSFVPDGPRRILDTRTGLGAKKGLVRSHGVVAVKVTGTVGVPAKGVSAVLMNVMAVQPTRSGTVTVYRAGTTRPRVTDLSFSAGQTRSDQVVAPVSDGKIDLYNASAGRTNLVVTLSGYFASTGSHGLLTTVSPARILSTGTGLGAPRARLGPHRILRLTVGGTAGVPKTGVTAVELSVAVRKPSRAGSLTAFANGASRPDASQLAFSGGQTNAGLITVPVRDGKVDLYNGSSGSVGLTADVTGYFSSGKGQAFQAEGPARALDTRTGLGGAGESVLAHSAAELSFFGLSGPPGYLGTQQDVVLSVTVLDARAAGSLAVFPDGSPIPPDPDLFFRAGKPVTIQVIVPVTGATVDFYNDSDGTIQITADVQGYGVAPLTN
jgi:hypothetical protein